MCEIAQSVDAKLNQKGNQHTFVYGSIEKYFTSNILINQSAQLET